MIDSGNRSDRSIAEGLSGITAEMLRMVSPPLADHSDQVAAFATRAGEAMELDRDDLGILNFAARHHDIGLLSLPPEIRGAPPALLEAADNRWYKLHPVLGQELLSRLPAFASAGLLVRHHHECWNGSGFPDRLEGETIPLGARILALADNLAYTLTETQGNLVEARELLADLAGTILDPSLLPLLDRIFPGAKS